MNKTAIRNFAIWARNKLIADVSYKAGLMGITKDGVADTLPQSTVDVEFYDIGTAEPYAIRGEEIKQRKGLVQIIKQKEKESGYVSAYNSVIEEVAYTWFNRLIAVRFMEVNDYMPSHIRVLSSETGKLEPDLVTTPFDAELNFSDAEKQQIIQLKNDNKLDDTFRMLFIKQCNALHEMLPRLFENTSDYSELLLNVSFVDQEGVVYHLVQDIDEDDFNIEKGGQVEIIGWLYQYYNAELKDETFALLKNNVKVTKERIPSATQLFTPDWIVRYMVENSLGRLWVEGHPNDTLKSGWKYYLDEAEQEAEVKAQLEEIRKEYAKLTPEDIKVIDPCMGSGHILVYAFDVLMQIYESAGYAHRDAAKSILENNLFGLDIDERAAQLAYFAVLMKARQYNRRILNDYVTCNVYAIRESNGIDKKSLESLGNSCGIAEKLVEAFADAQEFGSLLSIDITREDLYQLESSIENLKNKPSFENVLEAINTRTIIEKVVPLVWQSKVLLQQYEVVISNPPYMGNSNMNVTLSTFARDNYPDSKTDLFAMFIEKSHHMLISHGYAALITQHSWMFLSSFETLRKKMSEYMIVNMAHLGLGAFPELNSKVVQSVAFVYAKQKLDKYIGNYNKLFEKEGVCESPEKKETWLLEEKHKYYVQQGLFQLIPGCPIVYWISRHFIGLFNNKKFTDYYGFKRGIGTGDNERFLRLWHEVSSERINKRWYHYNKGGDFRRWYGNKNYVINWEDDGHEIKNYMKNGKLASRPQNTAYNFKENISYSSITTGALSFRKYDNCINDQAGNFFVKENDGLSYEYGIGLLNSKVAAYCISLKNSLNTTAEDFKTIPVIEDSTSRIEEIATKCMNISQRDWNSFETSWEFKKHPLI